jgi:hypothetical protein
MAGTTNPEKTPAAPMHLAQLDKKSRRECAQHPKKCSFVWFVCVFILIKNLKIINYSNTMFTALSRCLLF